MRIGRIVTALALLFVGTLALLLLRYDPWVYALAIDNPLIAVPLAGALAAFVGSQLFYRPPLAKRGVIFREGRFHRIDPRGEMLLMPGGERVAAEISLGEHWVRHAPIAVYDPQGVQHLLVFDLTWRLVPSDARTTDERERRVLLMSETEQRRIVMDTLEHVMRAIAQSVTPDELRQFLSAPEGPGAVRDLLCGLLAADALTVDRLHVQRMHFSDKRADAPRVAQERHAWTETTTREGPEGATQRYDRSENVVRGYYPLPDPATPRETSRPAESDPPSDPPRGTSS